MFKNWSIGLQRPALIRTGQKYQWLVHFFVWLDQLEPSKIFWPVHFCKKNFLARPDKLPCNKQLGFFNFWTPSLILNFKFSLENFINNYINSNARRFLNFYALKWQASRCSKFDVFEKFRKRIFSTFSFCIGASKVCQSHIELFSLSKLVANATNIQQRE